MTCLVNSLQRIMARVRVLKKPWPINNNNNNNNTVGVCAALATA